CQNTATGETKHLRRDNPVIVTFQPPQGPRTRITRSLQSRFNCTGHTCSVYRAPSRAKALSQLSSVLRTLRDPASATLLKMRIQPNGVSLLLSALLPSLASASGFDCANINVGDHKYDLSPLKGVHVLNTTAKTPDNVTSTTYRLNICNTLKSSAQYDKYGNCGTNKNICAFVHRAQKDGGGVDSFPFPIVDLEAAGEASKSPELKRLKDIDPETEGLRVKLEGGTYKENSGDKKGKKAGAIIEFQCDHERSGLEGLDTIEDSEAKERRRRAEGEEGGVSSGNSNSSLQIKSAGLSDDDTYILRLDWRTKYACDEYEKEKGDTPSSKSWGFFTWLIIIAFLFIAAYLIFGSWLNYNRYGARGWDLLPHGDTIRDIPYIFQDWLRRVVDTLQGAGSRGGYSAISMIGTSISTSCLHMYLYSRSPYCSFAGIIELVFLATLGAARNPAKLWLGHYIGDE
ncbi:hypothetical protein N7497_004995, partial [Penicillium chrysogenum]